MSLIKNSAWNIFGFVIPSLIAIPAMGLLARYLGVERFGLFTLAYAAVGYASIFDAGLSRAVVRSVAIHQDDGAKIRSIIGTSCAAILALGILAGGLLAFFSDAIARVLNVSSESVHDITMGLRWLSLSIPLFLLTQIWFAYLEGVQKFAQLNIQKIFTSSSLALFPAIAVIIHNTFAAAIIGLLAGRVLSATVSYLVGKRHMPQGSRKFSVTTFKELISFGGWVTVSNIVSPIMVYFDRFILSHVVGAERIAYYTAPSEAIARMLAIPNAVARALFPKLSDVRDIEEHDRQQKNSYKGILLVCILMVVPIFIFSQKILTTWMGDAYAGEPAFILRILLIGFVFNSMAQVPFAYIQAKGFSRVTALVHLAEVPIYLVILYFLISKYSIIGAALAWTIRVTIDFFVFSQISKKLEL